MTSKAKNSLSKQRLGEIATISENIAMFHILSCTHLIVASYSEAHMWTAMFSTKRSVYFSLLRESNFWLYSIPIKIEYLNRNKNAVRTSSRNTYSVTFLVEHRLKRLLQSLHLNNLNTLFKFQRYVAIRNNKLGKPKVNAIHNATLW